MRRRAITLVAGTALALLLLAATAAATFGASPTPSRAVSSDTRSALEGPGFVGDPAAAILLVVAIGAGALAATLLYVRLTGGSRDPRP